MPDFILQNQIQGGQLDIDTSGGFIQTGDSGEPIQITVLAGSVYIAVGLLPELDPARRRS